MKRENIHQQRTITTH